MSIFFIAEIGINHNGSVDIAKQLIDVAKKAGCNAVKFQKRDIDSVYTQDFLSSPRESMWGKTQRDQKQGLEFGKDEFDEIDRYCRQENIIWFASAWDLKSVEFLEQYDLKYNKIASAMITYPIFLERVAKHKKHTFISTGMTTERDIERAVKIFRECNCPFELMHCVSTYPMDPSDANLKCIESLKKRFSCDVGYSGHESGLAVSYAAAALGVSSIERHITLDRSMYGSDQPASVEPSGLNNLVAAVRKIESAMGNGDITFLAKEKPIADKLRAHIPA